MDDSLAGLARDLAAAGTRVTAAAAGVVAKGALNVKEGARRNATASSGTHAAQYPSTITYDLDPDRLGAEIGPERRGQGNLGPILEYGSAHNPPHRDLGRALDTEEPLFIAAALAASLPWP